MDVDLRAHVRELPRDGRAFLERPTGAADEVVGHLRRIDDGVEDFVDGLEDPFANIHVETHCQLLQ